MFAIAKRHNAAQNFRVVFRWLGLFLLFAAFSFSLVGIVLLNWLFPVTYHSAAPIIPIVAESLVFYGIYYIFMAGANITRRTWMAAVFTTLAAIINIILNLILIPHYGAMGAAVSTLLAYIVLASAAYIVNQRIYPVPFEIGTFVVALLIGIALYMGSDSLAQLRGVYAAWGLRICALCLYGGCLVLLGKLAYRSAKNKH
jgi:O-antigen/teichoic acid export membrane protein